MMFLGPLCSTWKPRTALSWIAFWMVYLWSLFPYNSSVVRGRSPNCGYVDETENVNDLKNKLKSGDRQVVVTTIQKLQRLITKRLTEGTPEYNKIKNLRMAFVVDECHRAITPTTKRELERFFGNSLWYGFTGTPRFAENPYPQLGDLPRTTEELYGKRLHRYTIQIDAVVSNPS